MLSQTTIRNEGYLKIVPTGEGVFDHSGKPNHLGIENLFSCALRILLLR
jgi:hypothetical protein